MINGAEEVLILLFTAIKLPADADIEEDDKCFPPPYLAKLKRGSNVQEVTVAPRGAPRRRRTNGLRRYGNCNQPGHTRSKCRFNSVWFDWNDQEDNLFQQVYRRSIPGPE